MARRISSQGPDAHHSEGDVAAWSEATEPRPPPRLLRRSEEPTEKEDLKEGPRDGPEEPTEKEEERSPSAELPLAELDAPEPSIQARRRRRRPLEREDTAVPRPERERDERDGPEDTRAGAPIQLEIVEGPDAGRIRKFQGVRVTVGRVNACHLKLSDPSVSRRHFELIKSDTGVLLRDLKSGNGTRVNGESVTERMLQHDDLIQLGKTTLRFLDEVRAFELLREVGQRRREELSQPPPGAADEPSPLPAAEPAVVAESQGFALTRAEALRRRASAALAWIRARRERQVGALGAAVALVLLIGYALLPSAPSEPGPEQLGQERLEEARSALNAEEFERAERLVREALQLSKNPDAEALLKQTRAERAAREALDTARGLMVQKRYEQARRELEAVPDGHERLSAERDALLLELGSAETDYKADQVEQMLDRLELEAAQQLLETLPLAKRRSLEKKLGEALDRWRARQLDETNKKLELEAEEKRLAEERRSAALEDAFVAVARKFHARDFERAAIECDRVMEEHPGDGEIRERAKKLKQHIPTFGRVLDEAERKYRERQLILSVKPLQRARELYQRIGFPGAIGQAIDEMLAAALLEAANDALAKNDLPEARTQFRKAAALDPSDVRPVEGMKLVTARVEELLRRAYMIKDREPEEATQLLRMILDAAEPGSGVFEQAKEQLSSMQQ